MKLGYCLPPDEREAILGNPPSDAEAFVDAVLLGEAVHPELVGTGENVGGGAVLDPSSRAVMNDSGTVVWLRARVDTLASRVGSAQDRPVLTGAPEGDVADALARLDAERRPLYEMVADVVVDVDGLEVADVARRVLEELGR